MSLVFETYLDYLSFLTGALWVVVPPEVNGYPWNHRYPSSFGFWPNVFGLWDLAPKHI